MMKQSKKTSAAKPAKKQSNNKIKRWLMTRARWQRWLVYVVVVILIGIVLQVLIDRSFKEVKNPNYGVSFSTKYAEELGVNWRENYLALLDDMGLRSFRLMSYWDTVEAEKGKYKFDDLDWQMDEAHKRGAKVSLSLGMRQPRWPECHKPKWYGPLPKADQDQALMDYVTETVKRYKNHPALDSYQLENEAVNNWFGECTAKDNDRQRLNKEFRLVKDLDPKHPVWMSLSDQHGLPIGQPVPDKYGYSVYRIVYNEKTGPFKFYVTYPTPIWYHRLRAWWIKTFKDRDVFIHELQLEPWGPVATKDISVDEQNRSMNLSQIRTNVKFARQIGKPDIYTWGGEWWYWRKVRFNDPSVWETVRHELSRP